MTEIMIWLVLLIAFIVIEVASLGLTTIWFAGGTLVAILANFLGASFVVQAILFIVVSLVLLFFTRPIAVKYFNQDRTKTNVESMAGKQGIVTGEINNLRGSGQVTVAGQEWSARGIVDNSTILEGAVVEVVEISGVKLIVKEVNK